jgi:hypothetical protein
MSQAGRVDSKQSAKADSKRQKADLAAEERSEDDGMAEHKEKSSDPSRWSDDAPARAKKGLNSER